MPRWTFERATAEFWRKVDRRGPDECWLWLGSRNVSRGGYGQVGFLGVHLRAHRLAFKLSGRTLLPGQCVLHSCDNPPCCNPRHLFPGTQADNVRDMTVKDRHVYGTRQPCARLNPELVRKVRALSVAGVSQKKIARQIGVTAGCIQAVIQRDSWAWVK